KQEHRAQGALLQKQEHRAQARSYKSKNFATEVGASTSWSVTAEVAPTGARLTPPLRELAHL
ncbi:MAG: hypothetical protein ABI767_09135, partial [Rhodanobacter sp.]